MTDTLEREPQAAATVDPRQARESARREIEAALARMGAIDDARTALALIAESALRYGADAGARGYRIVNENGEPRVSSGGGQAGDFAIADLVAELRRKHPTLFKPESEVAATSAADACDRALAQPAPRDWLLVAPDEPASPAAYTPATHVTARSVEVLRGRADAARAVLSATFQRASAGTRAGIDRVRGAIAAARPRPAAKPVQSRRRHVPVGYAAAAAAAALVLLGAGYVIGTALHPRGVKQEPQRTAAVAQQPEARPVAPAVAPAAPPAAKPATPSAATPEPRGTASVSPPPARVPLSGVPEVIDTATLRVEGRVARLFGVEWARGAQGEDLKRYLGSNDVRCTPAGGADLYRCEVGGKDISEVVLYNGGGRATSDAPADLVAAESHAKAEKLGVWSK